jgi:hypothetical protein
MVGGKISGKNLEQRISIKFCVKICKNASETLVLLTVTYDEYAMKKFGCCSFVICNSQIAAIDGSITPACALSTSQPVETLIGKGGQNAQSLCAYRHCHLCAEEELRQSQYSYYFL